MRIDELSVLMEACGLLLEKDKELVTVGEAIGLLAVNRDAVELAVSRLIKSYENGRDARQCDVCGATVQKDQWVCGDPCEGTDEQ
jgi:hypothetical protein